MFHDYEDAYDELDTPISRVFLLFKILLINLIFGCIFTIICFSTKRLIGQFLSLLLCGFCDYCDCDFDGSYSSRSKQPPNRKGRKYMPRNGSSCGDSLACTFWTMFKIFFSNKKLMKKTVLLLTGMLAGYLVFITAEDSDSLGTEPTTPICSFSNHKLFSEDTDNHKRVFFVMPTSVSGIQNARLVRIAQALFKSRHFITWVIVSTDPVSKYMMYPRTTEHWEHGQMLKWKRDENRVLEHLDDLYDTVSRFGIPFVILSGHEIHHRNLGFTKEQLWAPKSISTYMKAAHVGLLWVAKTFQKGVVLLGSDENAYNFNLFPDVQGTRVMSTWPSVFDYRYKFSISTPLLQKGTNSMRGNFLGGTEIVIGTPLQYANYALNIRIPKRLRAAKQLWKLTFDNKYTSKDIKVHSSRIQPLAKNCTQIYVWRLGTTFSHYMVFNKKSQNIPLKLKWMDTNAGSLHKLIKKGFAADLYTKQ